MLLNVVQGGYDGFGHQIEGIIRLVSLHLNKKIFYNYNFKKNYSFEHNNANRDILVKYIENSLKLLKDMILILFFLSFKSLNKDLFII